MSREIKTILKDIKENLIIDGYISSDHLMHLVNDAKILINSEKVTNMESVFNKEQQEDFLNKQFEKIRSIQLKKGNDYANEDRLSNFKLAGAISGNSAEINCLNLIATKVARLGVLLNSNNEPNNESIDDSVLDLVSYGLLLGMLLENR